MSQPPLPLSASEPDIAGVPADRIFLRDYVVEVEIGAFQLERGVSQRVRFALEATLHAPADLSGTDDVDDILSYDVLIDAVQDELARERLNLLETLAEGIASRVLAHAQVSAIRVVIEKLDRISGILGIDITRRQGHRRGIETEAPPVSILIIGSELSKSTDLATLIRTHARTEAAVVCIDAELPGPRVCDAPVAQRRIDLLAMGQAAWICAAHNPEAVVVETRTELDWGARHGQISLWAPAKMVVDALDDPLLHATAMGSLGLWLGGQIGASEVLVMGDVKMPDSSSAPPVRRIGSSDARQEPE